MYYILPTSYVSQQLRKSRFQAIIKYMDDQLPVMTSEAIELHIRNYRTLLKAANSVKISQLIDSHVSMNSILHEKGDEQIIDTAALTYALLRLPNCIWQVKTIILGQSFTVFKNNGWGQIENWQQVEAVGRRRKMYFDGNETLAVYIGSVTDVDDLVTLLTAFQIEWNKFHIALTIPNKHEAKEIITQEDEERLKTILGEKYKEFIAAMQTSTLDFSVKLLSGSYVEYARSTQYWCGHIFQSLPHLNIHQRPIYFVSSNLHSIANLLTQTVLEYKTEIIDFLHTSGDKKLIELWEAISQHKSLAHEEFFLHYLAKKFGRVTPEFHTHRQQQEKELGIHTVPAYHFLDVSVQVIELAKLAGLTLHPGISTDLKKLANSQALIINIDYPLGWAAYQILTEVAQNIDILRGVYIMGKAATLTGEIGDISLTTTVFDQHTKNSYVLKNALSALDIEKYFKTGAIFDHQKAITVKGTFFENQELISRWHKDGFTLIEMEAGPYLEAMYEYVYYNRYVENQFISLLNAPFEVAIAHYVSDTPNSKAKNLGVRNLSYEGVEATYGISSAILQKIFDREISLM